MNRHLKHAPALLLILLAGALGWSWAGQGASWKHLSCKNGDLPAPNPGTQQTSSVVFDIDQDGLNDFVITERTAAPSVVWYRRGPAGWSRHVLDESPLRIEAGSCAYDILTGRSGNPCRRHPASTSPAYPSGEPREGSP